MRTLIKHGLIVDPASHVHSKNNLLVEDGRIQGLTAEEPEADVILDAEGMVVSPGFVDIHMHEDPYDPEEGRLIPSIMTSMLRMGVTTAIGGNCGINTVSPLRYLELMDRDGGPINMAIPSCGSRPGTGTSTVQFGPMNNNGCQGWPKRLWKQVALGCPSVFAMYPV